jgi:hypothetical protein
MVSPQQTWPDWWNWEIDCSNPHLAKRMVDRSFNETDLRTMLEQATAYRPDREAGRWILTTSSGGKPWEVIVEPQITERVLLVVTAYHVG